MVELQNLHSAKGSKKKPKRIGRGHGSGHGKTSGNGHKGQNARSGGGVRPGFEGGQMPLQRRVPKRGFRNIFAKKVVSINVSDIEIFEHGSIVGIEDIIGSGLVKKRFDKIKILGSGSITKKLTVRAHLFSKTAMEKIKNAGGKTEVV